MQQASSSFRSRAGDRFASIVVTVTFRDTLCTRTEPPAENDAEHTRVRPPDNTPSRRDRKAALYAAPRIKGHGAAVRPAWITIDQRGPSSTVLPYNSNDGHGKSLYTCMRACVKYLRKTFNRSIPTRWITKRPNLPNEFT